MEEAIDVSEARGLPNVIQQGGEWDSYAAMSNSRAKTLNSSHACVSR